MNQPAFTEHVIRYGDFEAAVAPARGALVTQIRVKGKELLFLDGASFQDPTKNVRGGIPLLFPFAGKLPNDTFLPAGTRIGQHGFARSRAWVSTDFGDAQIRCTLSSDPETKALYPYDFVLEQTCLIVASGLQMELQIYNAGSLPMPVAPGWHPYFLCPADRKRSVTSSIPGFPAERISNDVEFDFGIVAPQNGRATFAIPGLGRLQMNFSPDMRFLQFWSLPERKFICIEPFTGRPNLINTSESPQIQPGDTKTFWMRLQLES